MGVFGWFVLLFFISSAYSQNRISLMSRWMPTDFVNPPVAPGMRLTLTISRDFNQPPCVNWAQVKVRITTLDAAANEVTAHGLEPVSESGPTCTMRDVILPAKLPAGPAHVRFSDENGVEYPPYSVEVVKARFLPATLSSAQDSLPVIAEHVGEGRLPVGLIHPATSGSIIAILGTGIGEAVIDDVSIELGDLSMPAEAIEHPTPGTDRILFAIPDGVALEGCYIPLRVFVSGGENMQTNPVTIPVMPSREPCRHPLKLTVEEMTALDAGKLIPIAHLHFSISSNPPVLASVDSRYMSGTEIAAIIGPEKSNRQALGCRELPVGSFQSTREFGISHPGGWFNVGTGLNLESPQSESMPIVNEGYTYSAYLQGAFTGGEWRFFAAPEDATVAQLDFRFHLPPPIRFTEAVHLDQLASGQDAQILWDGTKFQPGEVLSFSFTRTNPSRTFIRCVADATSGHFRLEAEKLAGNSLSFSTLWIVTRGLGRPLGFRLIHRDGTEAAGMVTFQAVQ